MKSSTKSLSLVCGALLALVSDTLAVAQEAPQIPGAAQEHEWLKQFAGEWESEAVGTAGPGQPEMKCTSKLSTKMLGDFWAITESTTDVQGMPMHAIQTIGYDSTTKKYVGTWVDSMVNYMWKTVGTVDSTGKILTLEAEGPNFMADGKIAKFRDSYEFKSKDHYVATSSMLDSNGKWVTFMTGNVRRKK